MKCILAGLLCSAALAAPAAEAYPVHENSRFSFSVEMPEVLQPEGDSDDGNGQRFSSSTGTPPRVSGSCKMGSAPSGR